MEVDGSGLRNSFAATSRFDNPSATKPVTCRSWAVSVAVVETSRSGAVPLSIHGAAQAKLCKVKPAVGGAIRRDADLSIAVRSTGR